MDLTRLYDARSKYTPEQKFEVVMHYAVSGSAEKTSKQTGVPANTIRQWKARSDWWGEAMSYCQKVLQDKLDGRLTSLINRMTEELVDRIENGDEVAFQGRITRKKMSGRELATSLAILYDKRALIRGGPTSITQKRDPRKELERLQKEFEKMFKEKHEGTNNA